MSEIDTSTAAIAALMDGVTAGPWEQDGPISAKIVWSGPDVRVCFMTSDGPASKNANFIAAARELVPALAAERDAAVALALSAEARSAELEAEVERMRAALGAEQDSADEMADVLSACGDGLMFDVDRLQAALDQHDALREAALSPTPVPSDAAAALDNMTAQARAQGMREAANILMERGFLIYDPILARAEEIEKEARNG